MTDRQTLWGELLAPLKIFCHGSYPSGHPRAGQRCRHKAPLAVVENGVVVVAYQDREGRLRRTVDPRSTTCPECGTARAFVGGVPEELGGSTGYYVGAELRGERGAA